MSGQGKGGEKMPEKKEVVAERQLLVWKKIDCEPVGPGLMVGQCREEMEAEGSSYVFNLFGGPKSSLLPGDIQNHFLRFCVTTPPSCFS